VPEWFNGAVSPPLSAGFRQRRKKPMGYRMFFVYIIKSSQLNRYYIGSTANLETRLKSHNSGKVKSTKAYRPWVIVYTECFEIKTTALKREKQIKSYKSGKAFRKLIAEKK
jgi:putative endonuclease